jgi:hypothetical protein
VRYVKENDGKIQKVVIPREGVESDQVRVTYTEYESEE